MTAAVVIAFARTALRPPAIVDGTVTIRYPLPVRLFLLTGVVFFTVLSVGALWPLLAGAATAKQVRDAWAVLVFLPFAAVLCAELRVRLDLDLVGIRGQTAYRGRRAIAWADVVAVRWSRFHKWFVLVDRHGTKVRISRFMHGHQAVSAMLRETVPAPVWEKAVAAWERDTRSL